ncbi:MAG: FtsX-like permease family protein [Pirellulales bacterium]
MTLLSIVIGVAAVVSVSVATSTTRQAYDQMFHTVSGAADLEIVAAGGGAFHERMVALAEQTAGVDLAVPLMQRYTIIYWGDGQKSRLMALGVDLKKDHRVRNYERTAGRDLDNGTGIWLDAATAKRLGIALDDSVRLLTRNGLKESKVVGLFEARGGSAVAQGGQLMMSLNRAQARFRARNQVDRVLLVLKPSADEKQVVGELAQKLPAGLTVRRPATRSQISDEMLLAAEQGLRLATAFALLIAVFIILNTFLMNVSERRKQLAIIRAIGGTRRQVARMLYREALVMAVAGIVLGIVVGLGGAYLLTRSVERLMQTSLPPVENTATSLALAIGFGLAISLLGAYLPARRAMMLTPMEAIRVVAQRDTERVHRWTLVLGIAVVGAAAALLAASIRGWLPMVVSPSASVALLVGIVMLIPLLLEPLSRTIELLLSLVVRVEARLGRRQLLRHRGRTALTIGVLFVASSTGIGLGTSIVDNVANVEQWYRHMVVGDFFVRAMMPEMATGATADMPEGLGQEIAAVKGVTDVEAVRFASAEAADQTVIVVIREFDRKNQQDYFDLIDGNPNTVLRDLRQGRVVIGTVLAHRANLKVGDDLSMLTREGVRPLRIAGITEEYLGGGLAVYMHRNTAQRLLGIEGVDAYVVQADPESLTSVEAALEKLCDQHGLMLQSYSGLIQMIDRMMSGVVGSLWGLLALGLIVASFGVVNTLTMNVLEQTREIGVLRVVAMTRRQLRRMILAQAMIMACIGLLPGAVAGVGVAYFLNLSTYPATGHPVEFVFHPALLAGYLTMALAIVMLAAWLPAVRAARLPLSEALHYE